MLSGEVLLFKQFHAYLFIYILQDIALKCIKKLAMDDLCDIAYLIAVMCHLRYQLDIYQMSHITYL